jgi:hypothetical protein
MRRKARAGRSWPGKGTTSLGSSTVQAGPIPAACSLMGKSTRVGMRLKSFSGRTDSLVFGSPSSGQQNARYVQDHPNQRAFQKPELFLPGFRLRNSFRFVGMRHAFSECSTTHPEHISPSQGYPWTRMADRPFRQLSIGLRRGATTAGPKPSVLEAGSLVPSNDQAVPVRSLDRLLRAQRQDPVGKAPLATSLTKETPPALFVPNGMEAPTPCHARAGNDYSCY